VSARLMRTLQDASDTSPGIGTWPPPIRPASERGWWGATRASRDQRRTVAGAAGDTVDTRGFNGFGEGHRRQDGGEATGQHRMASPRGAEHEDIVGRTPASPSALRAPLGVVAALTAVAQRPKDAQPKHPPPKRATLRPDRSPAPRMTSAARMNLDGGTRQARTYGESCR
jgi:hypothetical protein